MDGRAGEFVKEQYRHCKPILVLGASSSLLEGAGASRKLPDGSDDPGIVQGEDDVDEAIAAFIDAISQHRHWVRETDPPMV